MMVAAWDSMLGQCNGARMAGVYGEWSDGGRLRLVASGHGML